MAFDMINNIGQLTFQLEEWMTIIQGYQNVFLVMLLGYVWHFLPSNLLGYFKITFDVMPIPAKAMVLALAFWVVFATSTSGPQPFIYFQF